MDFNRDKVDAMTLALLSLVTTRDKNGYRAWKGFDWGTMDRLYEKGYVPHTNIFLPPRWLDFQDNRR
jgi:Domain of unknown function (DUF6429)